MPGVRTGSRELGGVRTVVREAGPGDAAEGVLFLHGNPGSGEDWTQLVGAVGKIARAVAVDLPGFGQAEKPEGFDYTAMGLAAWVDEAVEGLGLSRVHLVMHDFGGPIGLAWALQHPARWRSAALFNTGLFSGYRWHLAARIWRTPRAGELAMRWVPRSAFRMAINLPNPRPLPRDFLDRMHRDFDAGTRRAVLQLYRSADPDSATPFIPALRALDRPAMVVWGDGDIYIGSEHADRQRDSFPSATVHHIAGAGHWPFIDEPRECAELLLDFLREQLSP